MTSKLINIAPWRNHPIAQSFEYLLKGPLRDIECIIAGGSVRHLFLQEPMGNSDIDIWFNTEEDITNAVAIFKQTKHLNEHWKYDHPKSSMTLDSFTQVADTINGWTFVYRGKFGLEYGTKVQLLRKREAAPTVYGVLSLFDFTICQFAYKQGMIYATPEALSDHNNSVLRLNQNYRGIVCYDRAVKYMGKGYTPTRSFFDIMFLKDRTSMFPGTIELTNVFYEDGFKSNV